MPVAAHETVDRPQRTPARDAARPMLRRATLGPRHRRCRRNP